MIASTTPLSVNEIAGAWSYLCDECPGLFSGIMASSKTSLLYCRVVIFEVLGVNRRNMPEPDQRSRVEGNSRTQSSSVANCQMKDFK